MTVVAHGQTMQGVSPASWGIATATDGVHFSLQNFSFSSSQSTGAAPPTPPAPPPPACAAHPSEPAAFSATHHGSGVVVSGSKACASWPPSSSGQHGCDEVALLDLGSSSSSSSTSTSSGGGGGGVVWPQSYWVVLSGHVVWVDIGWCAPSLDVSGFTWMGWQPGKAFVYRASGLFKAANGSTDQGVPCECPVFTIGPMTSGFRLSQWEPPIAFPHVIADCVALCVLKGPLLHVHVHIADGAHFGSAAVRKNVFVNFHAFPCVFTAL